MRSNSTLPMAEGVALPAERQAPQCAFTVDVEDWYQSSVDFDAPISTTVERNVCTVLEFLDESGVKGSFFVQGLVAQRFPKLINRVCAEGHEIQSHGHTHRPLYAMDRAALRTELQCARKSVENACGVRVTAFRAPDFSILHDNLWALEVLAEEGFTIDSSIFPMRMKRYGIEGWPNIPKPVSLANGMSILEVPVAIWKMGRLRLPVAGGGYFRLLPQFLLKRAISGMLARHEPVTIYCHPYEFNPRELDTLAPGVSRRFAYAQRLGRASMVQRLRQLMGSFHFGRFDELLANWASK